MERKHDIQKLERHIKARAGQPLRRLLRLQRAEALFFEAREEFLAGRVVWSRWEACLAASSALISSSQDLESDLDFGGLIQSRHSLKNDGKVMM